MARGGTLCELDRIDLRIPAAFHLHRRKLPLNVRPRVLAGGAGAI
jgi:hypothetical protein